jgi:hypothetical protein
VNGFWSQYAYNTSGPNKTEGKESAQSNAITFHTVTQCVLGKNVILLKDIEGSETDHTLQELNDYRFLLRLNPQ